MIAACVVFTEIGWTLLFSCHLKLLRVKRVRTSNLKVVSWPVCESFAFLVIYSKKLYFLCPCVLYLTIY